MDKEFSVVRIWTWCLFGALTGFILCRWRTWLICLVLPLVLLLPFGVFMEFQDVAVAQSILREAGYNYIVQNALATIVALLGLAVGILSRVQKWRIDVPRPVLLIFLLVGVLGMLAVIVVP